LVQSQVPARVREGGRCTAAAAAEAHDGAVEHVGALDDRHDLMDPMHKPASAWSGRGEAGGARAGRAARLFVRASQVCGTRGGWRGTELENAIWRLLAPAKPMVTPGSFVRKRLQRISTCQARRGQRAAGLPYGDA
jgi:hypothetical protein